MEFSQLGQMILQIQSSNFARAGTCCLLSGIALAGVAMAQLEQVATRTLARKSGTPAVNLLAGRCLTEDGLFQSRGMPQRSSGTKPRACLPMTCVPLTSRCKFA